MELYTPRSCGEISTENRFISLRHIKESLVDSCNLKIIEETQNSLRGKINLLGKVYLPPIFGQCAIIEIKIKKTEKVINYSIFWTGYYMIVFTLLTLIILSKFINMSFIFYFSVISFHVFLIYMDSLLVKSKVKSCLIYAQKCK